MKRQIRTLFASLAVAMASSAWAASQPIDSIAAVINDEVITVSELALRVQQASRQLQKQGTQLPPQDVFARQLLERMVYERVQLQQARETSVKIDDATLERAIQRVAENNKMSTAQFRAALEKDGLSWSMFREEVRNEMTLGRLREREVESRVVITDAEVDAFLAAQSATSTQEVMIAHILLRAPDGATPQQWSKLQQRAESLLARAQSGEDFAKLAAGNSDASDALNGGNLGWRRADRLPSLYADAVRLLKPGAFAQVLRSPAGLHIVKLVDVRGGTDSSPQTVQRTRVRHILIKTSDTVSDAEARQRLEALRARIVGGASFADVAKRSSGDGSAPKGGDLGWINPGDTVPEFERAMNALAINELSQPVQSPFGWHLIEVLERKDEDVSGERRRNQARMALRERKSDEAFDDFVRQLRDKAFVELRPPYANQKP
ncbi:peptidylprolyl isomerase [Niveibacterium sp. 24ML]|uniref:peptidylprolyl isomerase n=1 Tax=Niveibacterium sp. 24ML TaxID=2985512 RepID=UPI00226DD233|nr:peptidylprolyl isomerase [Niveibacterium sp. 24ML]MCX9154569.1 peptidylprolyl isomerase [Niveibacterium sp. 24ML]